MLFPLRIILPSRLFLEEWVKGVILQAACGDITVLAHHEPCVFRLRPGLVSLLKGGKELDRRVLVCEGLGHVDSGGSLLVFAQDATFFSDVSKALLEDKIGLYRERLSGSEDEESRICLSRKAAALDQLCRLYFS